MEVMLRGRSFLGRLESITISVDPVCLLAAPAADRLQYSTEQYSTEQYRTVQYSLSVTYTAPLTFIIPFD